jgi:hypothetical protein
MARRTPAGAKSSRVRGRGLCAIWELAKIADGFLRLNAANLWREKSLARQSAGPSSFDR